MVHRNNTKQASWIALGSIFSFLFAILSTIVISRYFSKYDYGTYRQVLYIYNTLLIVFALGLPKIFSYYIPRTPLSEVKSLINKIFSLLLMMGFIFSLFLYLTSDYISKILDNKELALSLKYFSVVPFFLLPSLGIESILASFNKSKLVAMYTIISRFLLLSFSTLPVVLFDGSINQVIFGYVIASAISFILAFYLKFHPIRGVHCFKTTISFKEIFKTSFPLMLASIWGIIINSSDQFFISKYFGQEVFAEFSNGSFELPFITIIISSTSVVLTPLFSKFVFDKMDLKTHILPIWTRVFEKSVKLIYPIVIFLIFFSDSLISIMYTDLYKNSAQYFIIKLVPNFFILISYSPLLIAINKVSFQSKVFMIMAILKILLIYIVIYFFNSPFSVSIVSALIQIVSVVVLLIYLAKFFNVSFFEIFPIKIGLSIFFPSLIICMLLKLFIMSFKLTSILQFSFGLFLYVLFFSLWAFYKKIEYKSIFTPLIKRF